MSNSIEDRLGRLEEMLAKLIEPSPINAIRLPVVEDDGAIEEQRADAFLELQGKFFEMSEQMQALASHWRDLVITPSRSEAMLFAILAPLNLLLRQIEYASGPIVLDPHVADALYAWGQMTVAQRTSLEELFSWIDHQLAADDSVIPQRVLDNIRAAMG